MQKNSSALGLATLVGLGLAASLPAHAQNTPVTVSGFNRDVVVDSTENYSATQPFDTWNQWGFYSTAYPNGGTYTAQGLPSNGAFTSINSTGQYQFASYMGDNAMLISTTASIPAKDGAGPTFAFKNSGTLTLAASGHYSSIGILNSAAYGASTVQVTFNYSDAPSTVSSLNVLDWFTGGATTAINARRIDVGTNLTGSSGAGTPDISNPSQAHLYENYFTVDSTKTLTSITFLDQTDNTGGNANQHAVVSIFGINGLAAAPEPGEMAALGLGALGLGILALKARRRGMA